MKDKEKQIEEMVRDLYGELYYDIVEHLFDYEKIAKGIIKKGWVKLFEDSVVLSREELHEIEENAYQVGAATGKKVGGRESIEKFVKDLLAVWDDLEKWSKKYYEPHSGITPVHIKKFAKQFGVEIKE